LSEEALGEKKVGRRELSEEAVEERGSDSRELSKGTPEGLKLVAVT